MKANFDRFLTEVLKHEGGFVDHPKDPGGATNKGITIGTLRRLGIDVDGDGDSDLADLKKLRHSDVARVYRLFYWDAVKGDLLPSGLDFALADFAVNSGPSRAVKHLQRILGVVQDGDLGPKTLAELAKTDPKAMIHSLCESRLRFMRGLETWPTFGRGWSRRVDEVQRVALELAAAAPSTRIIAEQPPRTAEAVQDHSVDATEMVAPAVNPVGPLVAIGGALAVAAAAFWDKVQHWIGGLLP